MAKIMERREYQLSAVSRVTERLKNGERVVLVAPTGSGKTYMGALIALAAWGRVLWVAHRRELLYQAAQQFRDLGQQVGVLSAHDAENLDARIIVAGVRSASKVQGVHVVVVDECHRVLAPTYLKLLQPGTTVLGLTATPWRLDGAGLSRVFQSVEVAAQTRELITAGVIVGPVTYGISLERARNLVAGLGRSNDDYTVSELEAAMSRASIVGDVVAEHSRVANELRTIVFAVTRAHAKKLAARFRSAGKAAESLDGSMNRNARTEILARFASGVTQILVNVDVLSEGFDMSEVDCVSMTRPTRSITRYLQYVGRAMRPHGATAPIVLDHVGNVWRHGLPDEDRTWTLADRARSKMRASASPVMVCPSCGLCSAVAQLTCLGCGFDLSAHRRLLEDKTGVLVELSPGVVLKQCRNPTCTRTFSAHASARKFYCGTPECDAEQEEAKRCRVCSSCGASFRLDDLEKPSSRRAKCYTCRKRRENARVEAACQGCRQSHQVRAHEAGSRYCEVCKREGFDRPCKRCGAMFHVAPVPGMFSVNRCPACHYPSGAVMPIRK